MAEFQKRQPAYFVEVKEILVGEYTKTEGWEPNYITTSFGLKASRVNVIGTIIEKDQMTITIDDSSGIIVIRTFEEFKPFEEINTGDFVSVIGKIREYNDTKYITPEICTKLDPAWKEYKTENIELVKKLFKEGRIEQPELETKDATFSSGTEVVQEIVATAVEETTNTDATSLLDDIIKYIDENDSGEGVEKVRVLDHFDSEEVISALNSLIMEGDIFEIKPGVFKVLK